LFLVGAGEYLLNLQDLINELHLKEYVTVEPLHLTEELPKIICSCDLGVVPYRADIFTDGLLPTKLMEYAALGMPAVAARTSTIEAYFKNTNTEFFDPGSVDDLARCIISLYRRPDRMAELACGSQNFCQRNNWSKISKEYVDLIKRLGGFNFYIRDGLP
jgi:glycosyltransferase involved in cell wall biosynthesis